MAIKRLPKMGLLLTLATEQSIPATNIEADQEKHRNEFIKIPELITMYFST